MFGRSRFAKIVERAARPVPARASRRRRRTSSERLEAYNRADRAEAEELYGDYVDAVETGAELLAEMRDHFARTLDDAGRLLAAFNRAVAKRLPAYAAAVRSL